MPQDSSGTLVFCCQRSRRNSDGVTPNGGRWIRFTWTIFDQILLYLKNDAR